MTTSELIWMAVESTAAIVSVMFLVWLGIRIASGIVKAIRRFGI